MLDENLRILSRRLNDLEIELADKKDRQRTLERDYDQTKNELDCIYEEQTQIRQDMEKEMRSRIKCAIRSPQEKTQLVEDAF